MYGDEHTAESVARSVNGQIVFGGAIKARGPAEQRRRGHTGTYDGTIGYVPTKENDRRPYTDCIHYVTGVCVDSSHVSMTGMSYDELKRKANKPVLIYIYIYYIFDPHCTYS